ncbi:MAG: hypothetical protein QOH12_3570 [Solirubrobacteraceae bacterium]|nr:hypothetical protein [Solirubrobacteraceae bacterium]
MEPGDLFAGKYRVVSLAGRGGMGLVYKARQDHPKRVVALKVIHPALAGETEFRSRFEEEASLAAQIEHPNVIPIYDAGEADGLLFIVMRFVDGVDLGRFLEHRDRLDVAQAARIVGQVASALDAAHDHGLVHRDVKPANVLVSGTSPAELVYLTDFGLTKRITDVGPRRPTVTGGWVGTLDYIAPEQLNGTPADARSDVYSLACVLYQLLTGAVPFPAEHEAGTISGHLSSVPPSPSAVEPSVPSELDPVVARAMAKDPQDRYQSAGAFASAVSRAELAAADRRSREALATPGARMVLPSWAATAVACLTTLLAGAAGYFSGTGRGPQATATSTAAGIGTRAPRGPTAAYAQTLTSILLTLDDARLHDRRSLATARTPDGQAAEAARLGRAYERAINAVQGIHAGTTVAQATTRIITSMRSATVGYTALAKAAAAGQPTAYTTAEAQVRHAEAELHVALIALRGLGYKVT